MTEFHKQCLLNDGKKYYIVWIPEKFAIKGKSIIIANTLWKVIDTFNRMLSKDVNERSQDFKHQRKVSDI